MKLFYANTSPYARKARIVVMEKGLQDQVEAIFQNPFEDSPDLKLANPLGKVPTMLNAEGIALYDSRVICRYLNSLTEFPDLYPDGPNQWAVRTGEALCDGMLDALFALVMERRRPQEQQSDMWTERWTTATFKACDEAQRTLNVFEGSLTIAQIALGCALGYADFRTPDLEWRSGRDQLAAWYEDFQQRPSMSATDPANT